MFIAAVKCLRDVFRIALYFLNKTAIESIAEASLSHQDGTYHDFFISVKHHLFAFWVRPCIDIRAHEFWSSQLHSLLITAGSLIKMEDHHLLNERWCVYIASSSDDGKHIHVFGSNWINSQHTYDFVMCICEVSVCKCLLICWPLLLRHHNICHVLNVYCSLCLHLLWLIETIIGSILQYVYSRIMQGSFFPYIGRLFSSSIKCVFQSLSSWIYNYDNYIFMLSYCITQTRLCHSLKTLHENYTCNVHPSLYYEFLHYIIKRPITQHY